MESLVALFPAITWKTGAVPNELSVVVKEISGLVLKLVSCSCDNKIWTEMS